MKLVYTIAACAFTVFAAGVGCDRSNSAERAVDVEISNATDSNVTEAAVHFGQHRCYFGVLSPGKNATHMFYHRPITEKAVVRWTDANGTQVEKNADVGKIYNLKDSGTLRFGIATNEVKVTFTPRGS